MVIDTWDDDGPAVHVMATNTARRARQVLRLIKFVDHLAKGKDTSRPDREFFRDLRGALLAFLSLYLAPPAELTQEDNIIRTPL